MAIKIDRDKIKSTKVLKHIPDVLIDDLVEEVSVLIKQSNDPTVDDIDKDIKDWAKQQSNETINKGGQK